MLSLLLPLLITIQTISALQCPLYITSACTNILYQNSCTTWYEFGYNTSTAAITTPPTQCSGIYIDTHCFSRSQYACIPYCGLYKTGGPSGKVCSDFNNRVDCAKYYAFSYGADMWCEWTGTQCIGTQICDD